MSKYIDADLVKSTQSLYSDIDSCIDELLKARTEHKQENEGKALFRMEGLMVVTLQQLDCILYSLQQEQPKVDLEKEIAKEWERLEKDYSPSALDKSYIIVSGLIGEKQFSRIARHFFDEGYAKGLNARKEE